jgi:hypothetical protein
VRASLGSFCNGIETFLSDSLGWRDLNNNERNEAALGLYQRLGFTAERALWNGSRQLWLEKRVEP